MSWFGRSAVIGLGVTVTISTGLIALLIIKEALRRRNRRRLLLHNTSSGLQNDAGMDQQHMYIITQHIVYHTLNMTWHKRHMDMALMMSFSVFIQWTPRLFLQR